MGGPGDREQVQRQRLRQEARSADQEEKPQRLRALQGHAPQEAGEFGKENHGMRVDGKWREDRPFMDIAMMLKSSSSEGSADIKFQARFQVRKTLAAAKAA